MFKTGPLVLLFLAAWCTIQKVNAQNVSCLLGNVRFANGQTNVTEGLVEVCIGNNTWLRVCVNNVPHNLSRIICRWLGFSDTAGKGL